MQTPVIGSYPPRIHPDILRLALQEAVHEERMQPEGRVTHCDLFVGTVAEWYGFGGFLPDHIMANDIVNMMEEDKHRWIRCVNWDTAHAHASRGCLVVAGQVAEEHGHVCIIAPNGMEYSGSWNMMVPCCANVGKSVFYGRRISFAFHTPPEAWLYLGEGA